MKQGCLGFKLCAEGGKVIGELMELRKKQIKKIKPNDKIFTHNRGKLGVKKFCRLRESEIVIYHFNNQDWEGRPPIENPDAYLYQPVHWRGKYQGKRGVTVWGFKR